MTRSKLLASITVVVAAAALAACGGGSAAPLSPASPSSPGTPAAVTGATIEGVVSGLATSSSAVSARDVITVTVVGTNISATINAQGQFTLTGVPEGTVTLAFTSTSATVTLQNVGATQKIKIRIVIGAGSGEIEAEQHFVDGFVELEGRVSSVASGLTSTAGTFTVDTTTVTVTGTTVVRHGDPAVPVDLTTLKVGDRVHVTGTGTWDSVTNALSAVDAKEVIVQNTNANVPANLKGKIASVTTASCPAAVFVVEGWTVQTSAATRFDKPGCSVDLMKVGAEVHVKGAVQPAAGTDAAYVLADWVQFGK